MTRNDKHVWLFVEGIEESLLKKSYDNMCFKSKQTSSHNSTRFNKKILSLCVVKNIDFEGYRKYRVISAKAKQLVR